MTISVILSDDRACVQNAVPSRRDLGGRGVVAHIAPIVEIRKIASIERVGACAS